MPEWNLVSYFTAHFNQARALGKPAALLAAVVVGSLVQTGCSRLGSDQLTSQLLQERPILMPEDVEAGAAAVTLTQSSMADQGKSEQPEPLTQAPFRFSTDVPQPSLPEDLTDLTSNDFLVSQREAAVEVPAPIAKILSPLPAAQPAKESVASPGNEREASTTAIQRVAYTAPVADVADSTIELKTFPLADVSPEVVALAEALARGDAESGAKDVQVIKVEAVGVALRTRRSALPPQLSPADMKRVTGTSDWSAGRLNTGTIDLSQLEMPEPPETVTPKSTSLTSSQHLTRTVELLKHELLESSAPQDSLQVSVRLLELLQRKLDSASQLDVPMTNDELSYWQQQVDALALMMQTQPITTEGTSDQQVHQSTFAAIERLEQATDHLRSLAGLRIRGGQLCSQISGFGQYRLLDSNAFAVGDQALVYVEVENFESQQTVVAAQPQWTTRLQASYAVYDSTGRVVQQEQYPVIEDVARNRRRDFYLHLPLTVGDLEAGAYELQVVVEDVNRSASTTLPVVKFSVK